MRAIDTNVLVRLLIRDDARQAAAGEEFVRGGAWVSTLALAESIWVLTSIYALDHARIATTVEMLLAHERIALENREAVTAALGLFRTRPALGFTDCLMVEGARRAGHLPLGTFDRVLAKADGAEKL